MRHRREGTVEFVLHRVQDVRRDRLFYGAARGERRGSSRQQDQARQQDSVCQFAFYHCAKFSSLRYEALISLTKMDPVRKAKRERARRSCAPQRADRLRQSAKEA